MHLYWPRLLDDSGVNMQWLGGCCPWWSLWPSCDIGWYRCPGGQVVCPRWCVVQTSLPSGEHYGCGRSSCRTRWWFVSAFGDKPNFFSLLSLKRRCCAVFTMLAVWVDQLSLSVMCTPRNLKLTTLSTTVPSMSMWIGGCSLCCFLKSTIILMHLRQSVVLWQDMDGIQKIALFGKIPSPYYSKNSSNKQRETTVHHYFKTWRSVNAEHFKDFESFFKCSRKNHQTLWWNCLSWGPPQEWKTQSYLCCRGYVH